MVRRAGIRGIPTEVGVQQMNQEHGINQLKRRDFLKAGLVFGAGAAGCATAATSNIPCALPMIDSGSFGATQIRNGTQYFARIDAPFKSDRIYASLFRTLLTSGAASAMPQFSALNPTWQVAGQLN